MSASAASLVVDILAGFRFLEAPDDLEAAVAVRMERQRVLYRGGRRIACVLEEQALHTWFGRAETQTGQLDRLLAVMSLPTVSLGIVPLMTEREAVGSAGFWMFDDTLVALGDADREHRGHRARRDRAVRADVRGSAGRCHLRSGGEEPGRPGCGRGCATTGAGA